MRRQSPFPFRVGALGAILFASVLVRMLSAFYQGDAVETLPGVYDQVSYHALALRLNDGNGFSFATDWWPATRAGRPTAHWSYLYTVYLAGLYGLFGAHPLIARLVQAVAVGLLHPWLTWRIGRRLFGDRVGLAAALWVALYGYFVYYAGALMTESFYLLAILGSFDIATALAVREQGRRVAHWFLLGVSLAAAVLLRQVFMLFVPFLLGWLWYRVRAAGAPESAVRAGRGIAVTCVAMALMILPWTARNYLAFGRLVPVNTNAGFAFFWGNHPVHGYDFIPILDGSGPTYGSLIPRGLKGLDEASLDRELMRRGLGLVAADPERYLHMTLARAREYFKFWPSAQSSAAANLGRVFSFGLLLPLAAFGLGRAALARARGRRHGLLCDLPEVPGRGMLLCFMLVYSLVHLLSWALVRYRLPVDGVLVFYGACGVLYLAQRAAPAACAGSPSRAGTAMVQGDCR